MAYSGRMTKLSQRVAEIEAVLPKPPDLREAEQRALLRIITADADLRKLALRWFGAVANKRPNAEQLKDELVRLIFQKQHQPKEE